MSDNGSIAALFFARVEQYTDHPFLHAPAETRRYYELARTDYSYGEAATEVTRLIEDYRTIGCGVQTRVGIAMENRPEFFLHLLALNFLGASIVPLNVGMQDQELTYLISHSESEFLVVHPKFLEQFKRIAATAPQQPSVVEVERLVDVPKVKPPSATLIDSDTEAAIIYTSGTTGTPQRVCA